MCLFLWISYLICPIEVASAHSSKSPFTTTTKNNSSNTMQISTQFNNTKSQCTWFIYSHLIHNVRSESANYHFLIKFRKVIVYKSQAFSLWFVKNWQTVTSEGFQNWTNRTHTKIAFINAFYSVNKTFCFLNTANRNSHTSESWNISFNKKCSTPFWLKSLPFFSSNVLRSFWAFDWSVREWMKWIFDVDF